MDSFERLRQLTGKELGVSQWLTIDQDRINAFAAFTLDDQWVHTDPERAAAESSFGTTIAHGYLLLTLIPYLRRDISLIPLSTKQVTNYGIDYLRFLAPVRVGERIRLRIELGDVQLRSATEALIKSRNTIEIDQRQKPALIADILTLLSL